MSDPAPIGLSLFGFGLLLYAVNFIWVEKSVVGLDYALLIGGLALVLAGIISVVGGLAYSGYVMTTFGFWAIGLYFLLTSGIQNRAFAPEAVGWYCLGMLVPVAYLAIPAIKYRMYPFVALFASLFGVLACMGMGQINTDQDLVKTSGWFALFASALVWSVAAYSVLVNTGVLTQAAPSPRVPAASLPVEKATA
ncbi:MULTISPECIES: GPR1/FUN34/YaaH family transporter [unclassified Pseudofrankia]|uniref:GPR1/FUN34/YaaH family transporter n=1 Tax=unclassified Pseudofrankia TaxID=2994372 RepID=UPI0008DA0025|nr:MULTISPECIES: GPR1/FUN34/YaaH family transporter [unclassified Pseudofrankia]MDT3442177.1 GPR1/FUN34/YaaH family transporter [Pseudofrankia sp. BMG5.37]OHV43604.1 hypothetical protein BCD48_27945 [Pseudofrankia sp. BMG5.36]